MAAAGNSLFAVDGITLGDLLGALADHSTKPLVFARDGTAIRPGYHVTEVRTGRFTGLDCGANPEAWTETFIQLWDVNDDPRQHMPIGKFSAIMNKVAELSPFDASAKLTFEVSDGVEAMQLFQARSIDIQDDAVVVDLARRPASCKPRDRWLVEQDRAAACCAPASKSCCA